MVKQRYYVYGDVSGKLYGTVRSDDRRKAKETAKRKFKIDQFRLETEKR